MRSAETPVIAAAHSGVWPFRCAASASKPRVCCAMKARSWRCSATITCISPSASAESVPGLRRTTSSDWRAASVSRTSSVTMKAPRRRAAATCRPVFGWLARFAPQSSTICACCPRSSFVFTSSTPVTPNPKPPSPQQIIAAFHDCEPWRLANRRIR